MTSFLAGLGVLLVLIGAFSALWTAVLRLAADGASGLAFALGAITVGFALIVIAAIGMAAADTRSRKGERR